MYTVLVYPLDAWNQRNVARENEESFGNRRAKNDLFLHCCFYGGIKYLVL